MNNLRMEIHAKKVEERCRVCGSFLVEDKAKKKRKTYNCIQFAKDLPLSTPPWTCTHHPLCDTPNSIPFEWKAHTEVDCMVIL